MGWKKIHSKFPLVQKNKGYTLVEVVLAVLIFGFMVTGISSSMIFAQKQAFSNIMDNTAFSVAQGYLEQIKSMSFEDIASSTAAPGEGGIALETKSIILSETQTENDASELNIDDPLFVGVSNARSIALDYESAYGSGSAKRTLEIEFTPILNNISATSGRDIIEIRLEFTYNSIFGDGSITRTGAVQAIKTDVTE